MTAASAAAQERPSLKPNLDSARERAIMARELEFARKAAANGDIKVALALYDRVLKRDPGNARVRRELAALAPAAGKVAAQRARQYRQLAERADHEPGNVDANLSLARAAERRGDAKKAMRAYERVLARDPNNRAARDGMIETLVAQVVPPPPPPARRPTDDDLNRLFDEIMRDPGNVDLNLRYARLAIDKGEPRKAVPAYERVLARDPNNAEARAGLARVQMALEPTITQVTASMGGFYESNPRHFRNSSARTQAGTFAGRFTLFDERRLGDIRWRTEGETYFSYHTRFHEIDYGLLNARTGPVFTLNENMRLNPFVGGGYAWLKGRSFYLEAAGGATLEFERVLPLHSVTARAGYNDISNHISTRDGVFVEIAPRLLFPNVGYPGTAAWLTPFWRYNGVTGSGTPGLDQRTEPFPARAHQAGIRGDYFMPITSILTVGVNAAYEYRHFYEPVSDGSKNRRDHLVSPGAQAIFTGLIDERFGIIVSYGYEHRFSNDGPQTFTNHAAGVRLLWRN